MTGACGPGSSLRPGAADNVTPQVEEAPDVGAQPLPGSATLIDGLSSQPDLGKDVPAARLAAQAGVDFASNRFIAIFENSPDQAALATYLGGGTAADLRTARDNYPLVDHPYLRRVSHNLAGQYGLRLFGRVFYKDVNYCVLELPEISAVGELDTMMRRVLTENRGLVREVCYDVYVRPVDILDGQGLRKLTQAEVNGILSGNPAGLKAVGPGRRASAAPDDPMHINRSGSGGGTWANWRCGTVDGEAWDHSTGGTDVLVAVIDTGIRMTHQDLDDNVITPSTTPPFNAAGILTDVQAKDNDPSDGYGHGTNCAGCVGARGNNALGLAGMNQVARILPIKIFNNSGGGGSDSVVAEGMLLADYLGADILSLSIGGPFADRTTQLAVRQVTDDGCLVIVSAGNENTSAPSYPGYYNEVLCIGATTLVNASGGQDFNSNGDLTGLTRHDGRATFSNYGEWVDIAAPGIEVRTTGHGSDSSYTPATAGTSFSCPYVAGCAALLWQYVVDVDGSATAEQVKALLLSSATEMTVLHAGANPDGFLNNTSNGTVRFCNVSEALDLFDAGGVDAPEITWDNPLDGSTVTGDVELRVAVDVSAGNSIHKVQFETPTRLLGTVTTEAGGFYALDWDTTFEFNRELEVTARAYDNEGNIASESIEVTPDNTRVLPAWSESFTGLADDALPGGWFRFDGNQGTSNTAWGGNTADGSAAAPCMKSTGSSATYSSQSNDWLFAPLIDLSEQANSELSFMEKHTLNGSSFVYLLYTTDDMTYYGDGWSSSSNSGAFASREYDLDFLAGEEVRVMWIFQLDGGGGTGGMYVDDVAVSGSAGMPPTIDITSPAAAAIVSGVVEIDVTVSDDTDALQLESVPPLISSITYSPIPDNDGANPTKTYTISWDSRHTYSAGSLLAVSALVDETDDGSYDLQAADSVAVTVDNVLRNPNYAEGFESISTLGGLTGGGTSFDGDWYVWSGGSSTGQWRIESNGAHSGSDVAKMGASSGNYGAGEADQLYSPMTDLSGAANPYLRIWYKLDTGGDTGDCGKLLLVRYDGLVDIETPMAEYRSNFASWTEQVFDLSAYQDEPIRFNFLFLSDGDGTRGTGWFLDDIEILDADPLITSITPGRGVAGTTSVTVGGQRFGAVQGGSSVLFTKTGGGTVAGAPTAWSNTSITVPVPPSAVSGDVVVRVLGFESPGSDFRVILPNPDLTDLGQR